MSLHQIPGHYIVSTPGEGGIDSATCSAIASAYAESAVSAASSNYYTTANESGYALSSDVSGTVDIVSTQSANWGGSALALSAGPGVKLEKVGDTLVASTDETVLWSGSANTTSFTGELSESISHFQYVELYAAPNTAYIEVRAQQCTRFKAGYTVEPTVFYYVRTDNMESNTYIGEIIYVKATDGTAFTVQPGCRWNGTAYTTGISSYKGALTKIVGINRTAGV